MATFVSDTFTDTDGTNITAHTGETGATWTRHGSATVSTSVINSNALSDGGSSNDICYASGLPAGVEYTVSAVTSWPVTGAACTGICGRMDTAANTFYMLRNTSATSLELFKRVAGTFTSLGTFTISSPVGTTQTLNLEITDATKKAFQDGTERISSTDNAITAAGRAGLRGNGSSTTVGGIWLSLSAFDLGAVVVALGDPQIFWTDDFGPGDFGPDPFHECLPPPVIIATSQTFTQTLSVVATAAVVAVKQVGKIASATSTGAATLARLIAKATTTTATATVSGTKQVGTNLSTTATGAVALAAIRIILKALSVTATGSVSLLKRAGKSAAVTATATPALVRSVAKTILGSATATVAVVSTKVFLKALTVTVTGAASLTRSASKALSVPATAIGGLTLGARKGLAVAAVGAVSVVKRAGKALGATATGTASSDRHSRVPQGAERHSHGGIESRAAGSEHGSADHRGFARSDEAGREGNRSHGVGRHIPDRVVCVHALYRTA
jgi:hypothetical protein